MECKAHLRSIIYQMMDYISDLAPEVRVEDENVRYESEHANLAVYPPLSWTEDQCDELQTRIGERITDLNIETGYLILVGVYSPVEQVAEMQRELAVTQKKIKSLEARLSEAKSMGLLWPIQTSSELVLA